MSGTAFDGSPWLTALEIGGLVVLSFGGAAVGASLMRSGFERSLEREFEAAQAEAIQKLNSKRRRYAANAKLTATNEDVGAEELVIPNVVEEVEEESMP